MIKYLLVICLLTSCAVTWTPVQDPTAITLINRGQLMTRTLYDRIIASDTVKAYAPYQMEYANIHKVIDELLKINSQRDKAKKLLIITEAIKERMYRYEMDHTGRMLNNTELSVYKDYMDVLWKNLFTAESSLKTF